MSESSKEIRVGLLAYGAIGDEHNKAIGATQAMRLTAVADTNPERLVAAKVLVPDVITFNDSTQMLDSGLLDLVVISTPPNSHYLWAKESLNRGIHVILEKPMALSVEHCDELMALAASKNLLLVVYQNRRFDADFVTMKKLIDDGVIGEVFSYESFVGGYSKPCDYWHSDVAVSGGAIFDWGSHYLDQILDVFDQEIAYVSGVNHKRHWTHVTNADHSVVTVTFGDGTQATFVNSDLSAARPPKFRVFGTQGAIVADWDPAAEPAVADLPALVTLYAPDGSSRSINLDEVPAYTFHRELAAHLASGTPMQVSAQQSRNVVAVMEAAEESAKDLGRQVVPELLR